MDGHDVGVPEQRIERLDAVDPGGDGGGGEVRVEGRDAHPEAARDPGDMPRDAPEPDQAEDLAHPARCPSWRRSSRPTFRSGAPTSAAFTFLATSSIRVTACSAVEMVGPSGVLQTAIPAPGRRRDVDRVVADAGPGDDPQARGAVHGGIAERHGPDDRRDGRRRSRRMGHRPWPARGPCTSPRRLAARSGRTGRSNQTAGAVMARSRVGTAGPLARPNGGSGSPRTPTLDREQARRPRAVPGRPRGSRRRRSS